MEYLIFFRLIHIVCAVIWTGGMIYYAAFVIPAARTMGPDGARFLQGLLGTNKLPIIMNVSAILTIATGIYLMKKLLGGFQLALFNSTHGALIVIGSLLALIGFIIGIGVNLPAAKRMSTIGKSLAVTGTQPTSGQFAELQKLRKRSFAASNFIAVLLFASLILMSMVKYV
jgi:uncharacterized membrane protein